jgi:hypothetical protein
MFASVSTINLARREMLCIVGSNLRQDKLGLGAADREENLAQLPTLARSLFVATFFKI